MTAFNFFRRSSLAILVACAVGLVGAVKADPVAVMHGGDRFVTGTRIDETAGAPRDLLVGAARARIVGDVTGDVHAAGFSIRVDAQVADDLTAAGAQLSVDATVLGDATLAGFVVTIQKDARIGGNARLFAGSATIEGQVDGSVFASANEVYLNATVGGDLRVTASGLTFGPDAMVAGRLILTLPNEVVVPASVATSDRITYAQLNLSNWREFDEMAWEGVPESPTMLAVLGGYLIVLGFLLCLGGAFLVLAPNGVANMRRMAITRPGVTLSLGGFGLSALVGLIPVSAMTIIGLPLVPFAVLAVLVAWVFGYLLGAYVLAMAIARAAGIGDMPKLPVRLVILAAAITGAALLNFVPFIGWIANVLLVFLGLGAMTEGAFRAVMPQIDPDENDPMMGPPGEGAK